MPRAKSKPRILNLMVVAALTLLPVQRLRGDDSAELLDRVTTAHRAARESIRTLQASFKIETVHPRLAVVGTGTYLRSPDGVLIRVGKEGEATNDTLVKGGEMRMVGRNWSAGNKLKYTATRASGSHMLGLSDIWQRLLLSHYGPNQQTLPFEQYVETATSKVRASRSREGEREIITVTMSVGSGREQRDLVFEFDAKVNYLMRKGTLTAPGENGRDEAEIVQFLEVQPGVFVPVQCRARSYKDNAVEQELLYTLTDPIVNAPVPANRLTLPAIPSGTVLKDRIHDTKYPIDANWNQIGPATPNPILRVGGPSSEPVEYTTQSATEPRPMWHLIILVSVLVLLTAGAVWGVRRWRRGAATT
jgi:hypothetical protein